MAADGTTTPIIIVRKKKKGGHEHTAARGKMAYADFGDRHDGVLLVMWLVSAVSKEQRGRFSITQEPQHGTGQKPKAAPGQRVPGASTIPINAGWIGRDAPYCRQDERQRRAARPQPCRSRQDWLASSKSLYPIQLRTGSRHGGAEHKQLSH